MSANRQPSSVQIGDTCSSPAAVMVSIWCTIITSIGRIYIDAVDTRIFSTGPVPTREPQSVALGLKASEMICTFRAMEVGLGGLCWRIVSHLLKTFPGIPDHNHNPETDRVFNAKLNGNIVFCAFDSLRKKWFSLQIVEIKETRETNHRNNYFYLC